MFHIHSPANLGRTALLAALILSPMTLGAQTGGVLGAQAGGVVNSSPLKSYAVVDLVSNVSGVARIKDPSLVNAWGLALALDVPCVRVGRPVRCSPAHRVR